MSIKHKSINWKDGMKLSSAHFKENDAYHHDQLAESTSLFLTNNNFGLLPPEGSNRSSLELDLRSQTDNRVEIYLKNCNAVTIGGSRIIIESGDVPEEGIMAAVSATDYQGAGDLRLAVILTANHYNRIPVGAPDPEESPLRHPFTLPSFKLDILPLNQVNLSHLGGQFMIVGVVQRKNDRFSWEEKYIPPCTVVAAQADLLALYDGLASLRTNLRSNAVDVLQKTMKEERQNTLAQNTKKLCDTLLKHLAQSSFEYRNEGRFLAPIFMVKDAATLASLISVTLYSIPIQEKEELLQYYYQWVNVPPREFEDLLSQMIEIRYEHMDMTKSLRPTHKFLNMIAQLWQKLSNLKFIGQQKDNIIVREEDSFLDDKKQRFSFFD